MGSGQSAALGSRGMNTLKTVQRMQRTKDYPVLVPSDSKEKPSATENMNGLSQSQNKTNARQNEAKVEQGEVKPNDGDLHQDPRDQKEVPTEGTAETINGSGDHKEKEPKTEDDAGTGDDDSVKKQPLTEEELGKLYKTALDNIFPIISELSKIQPRDLEQENAPYTKEFRKCALVVAKCYFALKIGRIPYSTVVKFRNELIAQLLSHNVISILCDVLADGFKRKDYISESGAMIKEFLFPMKNIILALLNFSDRSNEVKIIIVEHPDLMRFMTQVLSDWQQDHLAGNLTEEKDQLVKWLISIAHNCGMIEENAARLRELSIIKILLPYLDSPKETIRLGSIATLADIVNEEEAELLQTHQSIFKFIVKKLKRALKKEDHKDLGWSAEELTRALKQLARNDANKKVLVHEGCLPVLVKLINVGSEAEIKEALDCIWALTFDQDNKQTIVDEEGLMECVHSKFTSSDGVVKHSCHGIMWSLRKELSNSAQFQHMGAEMTNFVKGASSSVPISEKDSKKKKKIKKDTDAPSFEGHLMISYQWANQELIKRISQELRSHGIPVWIDVDYMGGSTLQAMAKAVEDSFAVIIAMSQRYKDSPNTRAEAEYAFQLRKKIIPLIMEKNYRPDGWLGLILGSKLFYDFSGKYSYESRMEGLLKAILVPADSADGVDGVIVEKPVAAQNRTATLAAPAPQLFSSPTRHEPTAPSIDEKVIVNWSPAEKSKWLTKHKLEHSGLAQLTGEEIVFLHNLKFEAPEFFYRCLEDKLQLHSLLELSRAAKALADLSV